MLSVKIQLSVPEPCPESWNAMTVVSHDERHCASCDRVLTDFSVMSDDELMLFFSQSRGKLCGRFSTQQLNRPLTTIPEPRKPRRPWLSLLLIPLSFYAQRAKAQEKTALRKYNRADLCLRSDSAPVPDTNLIAKTDSSETDSVFFPVPDSLKYVWSPAICVSEMVTLTIDVSPMMVNGWATVLVVSDDGMISPADTTPARMADTVKTNPADPALPALTEDRSQPENKPLPQHTPASPSKPAPPRIPNTDAVLTDDVQRRQKKK